MLSSIVLFLPLLLRRPLCSLGVTQACDNAPLLHAIISGNTTLLGEVLAAAAVDPLLLDAKTGLAPMLVACSAGDVPMVAMLLQHCKYSPAVLTVQAENGQNCISIAAEQGHEELVKQLSMYGTSVDAAAKDGSTPLLLALRRGQYDIARLLMRMKADVNRKARGVAHGLSSQVLRDPADTQISAMTYPTTALQMATKAGEHSIMKELLDRGAEVNVGNDRGVTPLMMAAANDDAACIRMLRDYGASLEAIAAGGFRALSIAVWYKAVSALSTLLELGAAIKSELADRQHPLHLAARHGSLDVVSLLLQAISKHDDLEDEVDSRDVHGLTPLLLACSERQLDIVRVLLEHNADPNAASRNGLQCAMLFTSTKVKRPISTAESDEIIALLLRHGADLDAKSSADVSAVVMAVQGKHDMYAAALIRAGVDTMSVTTDGLSLSRFAANNKLPLTLDALRQRQITAQT